MALERKTAWKAPDYSSAKGLRIVYALRYTSSRRLLKIIYQHLEVLFDDQKAEHTM